jgi:hypothetical protein
MSSNDKEDDWPSEREELWPTDQGRLHWILWYFEFIQAELAEEVGYPAHYINDLARGKKRFPRELAEAISAKFGVDMLWMLTGKGNPWGGKLSETAEGPPPRALVVIAPTRFYCGRCGVQIGGPDESTCRHCKAILAWPEAEK